MSGEQGVCVCASVCVRVAVCVGVVCVCGGRVWMAVCRGGV